MPLGNPMMEACSPNCAVIRGATSGCSTMRPPAQVYVASSATSWSTTSSGMLPNSTWGKWECSGAATSGLWLRNNSCVPCDRQYDGRQR